MMAAALREAAIDAGDPALVQEADAMACVEPVAWGYQDLVSQVSELAGVTGPASPHPPEGLVAPPGGDSPCLLLNEVANRIMQGDLRIALLGGADAMYSRRRARREGLDLEALGWPPPSRRDLLGGQRPLTNALEARHGLLAPIHCYPLYENALRAEVCRSIEDHRHYLGELMAANAAVARDNPVAWFQDGWSAQDITTVTPDNRWICFPYPKRMNAIMDVDQAAALVVMSSAEAERRQIEGSRRVALLGGGSADDAWTPTERCSFTGSPAHRAASAAAFEQAGVYPTEIDLFDLYSCFPSAVQFAMKSLSLTLDDPRPRTVTGGLAYAGGPGNNYATHALAAMVARLRGAPNQVGYVSALGMTASKHAVSILSSDASRISAASGIATPNVPVPDRARFGPALADRPGPGPCTVETYTVDFDRAGAPSRTILVLRLADGRRTVANGQLADAPALMTHETVGVKGWVEPGEGTAPNRFLREAPPA